MKRTVRMLLMIGLLSAIVLPSYEVRATEVTHYGTATKGKSVESDVGVTFDNDYVPVKGNNSYLPRTSEHSQKSYQVLGFFFLCISLYVMRIKLNILKISTKERK